ncbi:hypothetical protein Acsp03_35120 [Actinomadura sp. NBRC 104412]|uniref:serine hydrolase n=1 Tax=Actinomadura sp. NBRC 104412 TaxID=3032203 RepID=UPI0024A498A3|nr:serine hydrolase [Actinomadura sp. NBRC 104412]GLZ06046.1 hypothetical protein Acsp03_35120 [Actinomadura sp. NBRC 104412]
MTGSHRSSRVTAALTLLGCLLVVVASSVAPLPDNRLVLAPADPPLDPVPMMPSHSPTPSTPPRASVLTKADRAELSRALERYLNGRPGRLSVAIKDLTTGRSFSYGGRHRPATASVVKVDVVAALMLRAQRDDRALTSTEKALAAQAIKVSDNDATDALWSLIGGAEGLRAANRRLGLRDTEPGPGGAWGVTTTSAADQVRLLAALASPRGPLGAAYRRHLLGLMADVAPEQAWGVSACAGKGAEVALKNGWLPRKADGGAWTVNSVGRVRDARHDYLIAVLSDRHPSMGAGVETVERVTRMVTGALGGAPESAP